jgi:hypothetical protein
MLYLLPSSEIAKNDVLAPKTPSEAPPESWLKKMMPLAMINLLLCG